MLITNKNPIITKIGALMKNNTPFLRYIALGNHLPNKSYVRAYDCRFFYVLSGKGTLFTEKGDFELCSDTLCYYPSG